MSYINRSLGLFIRQQREALGLNQKQVAAMMVKEDGSAYHDSVLNPIEIGKSTMSDHTTHQVAKALEINPDILFLLAGKLPPDIELKAEQIDDEVLAVLTQLRPKKSL